MTANLIDLHSEPLSSNPELEYVNVGNVHNQSNQTSRISDVFDLSKKSFSRRRTYNLELDLTDLCHLQNI